ncbi:T9SS type A sorting domain-containing protein [Hymenobacter armeniacus]|uniref:T9SS type A sorting domain-containing protein n=1 Tax=Hymenobacter armeniacus TaxID=2771358 RepID=A0ABR8K0Z5_9BACT|nr:T9SS type A sorting domain-containing protein [Hymenobacter armeniacus]MBD2723909.1 T9SS type A sorting domain-containing protein [Hymenobacter armeniacus]
MKLFTRIMAVAAILAMPLAPVLAATITIQVGDNFYAGPDGTNTIRIARGDVLVFQYVGQSSHPTMSDSSPAAWATFQMNSANLTKTFPANTFAVGTYPFHCTAHGAPGLGQFGTLIVTTNTATLDANAAGIALSVYPNPSHGQVTVKLDQKPGIDYKLRLSNIIGQEVRTIALKPELTVAGLPLDLSDLRAGLYMYSLLVDGKVVSTKRIVLQN